MLELLQMLLYHLGLNVGLHDYIDEILFDDKG